MRPPAPGGSGGQKVMQGRIVGVDFEPEKAPHPHGPRDGEMTLKIVCPQVEVGFWGIEFRFIKPQHTDPRFPIDCEPF